MKHHELAIAYDGTVPLSGILAEPLTGVIETLEVGVQSAANHIGRHKGRFAGLALATSLTIGALANEPFTDATSARPFDTTTEDTALYRGNKDRGSFAAGAIVGGGVVGAAGYLMKYGIGWPTVEVNLTSSPAEVIAGVKHDSYKVENDNLVLYCESQVSVAVGVKGKKSNTVYSDGHIDKMLYGDFLLCGELNELTTRIHIHRDPTTGEIVKITGTYPELRPTHARVDHDDVMNCLSTDSDMSMEEIDKKLEERKAAIAAGKTVKCYDGFSTSTGLGAPDKTTTLISLANSAAQLAISLDAWPKQAIKDKRALYQTHIDEVIRGKYAVSDDKIQLTAPERTDEELVAYMLDRLKEETSNGMFERYEIIENDKGPAIKVYGNDGMNVTVQLSSYVNITDFGDIRAVLLGDDKL